MADKFTEPVNIPKATIHRDCKEQLFKYTYQSDLNKIRKETDRFDRSNHA